MKDEIKKKILDACTTNILDLDGLGLREADIQEIFESLGPHKSHIVSISLDRNALGDSEAHFLSNGLKCFSKLSHLSIQFNQIGKEGALHLYSLKKDFPQLNIAFHGNKIRNVATMLEIQQEALRNSLSP